jgi:ankyrin repeat protein
MDGMGVAQHTQATWDPRRFPAAAVIVATTVLVAGSGGAAHASQKVCRVQEQRYEQIEKQASSIEINSVLFSAAEKGCLALAEHLLDIGASLQARDRLGFTALSRAAASGQAELVALFLDRGAAIDGRSIDGSTALYEAAEAGRLPIVRQLVERGANINVPGRTGVTPLAAGAYMGSEPIVALLIEKGADPKAVDDTNKTAIIYAAGKGFSGVVQLLLNHRVDVNARYGHDLTALMWTAGYTEEAGIDDVAKVLTLLLDRGARVDDQDDRGRTALMIAAELNHEGAVDLLLSRGADKTLRDKQGKSAGDLTSLTTLREKLASR